MPFVAHLSLGGGSGGTCKTSTRRRSSPTFRYSLQDKDMIFFFFIAAVDAHGVTVRLMWIRQISKSNESPCGPRVVWRSFEAASLSSSQQLSCLYNQLCKRFLHGLSPLEGIQKSHSAMAAMAQLSIFTRLDIFFFSLPVNTCLCNRSDGQRRELSAAEKTFHVHTYGYMQRKKTKPLSCFLLHCLN